MCLLPLLRAKGPCNHRPPLPPPRPLLRNARNVGSQQSKVSGVKIQQHRLGNDGHFIQGKSPRSREEGGGGGGGGRGRSGGSGVENSLVVFIHAVCLTCSLGHHDSISRS